MLGVAIVARRAGDPAAALARRHAAAAARAGAGAVVGRRRCWCCSPARSATRRRRRARRTDVLSTARPDRLRLGPVGVPVRPAAQRAWSAPAPCRELLLRARRGARHRRRCAACWPTRSATARSARVLARGQAAAGSTRDGHAAALPGRRRPRARWTPVELEGRRVGAIVHDATLCAEPELLRSVAAAAGLAMRERAAAGPAARPRGGAAHLARPDRRGRHAGAPPAGAQPARRRPAAARRALADAADRPGQARTRTPTRADELLDGAQEELTLALEELRELARGIHPACCPTAACRRGARGARRCARRCRSSWPRSRASGCPSRSRRPPTSWSPRRSPTSSSTPTPAQATVRVQPLQRPRRGGGRDDGIGGADPGRGSGLRGLADRVSRIRREHGARLSRRVGH